MPLTPGTDRTISAHDGAQTFGAFINGEEQAAQAGGVFPVTAPETGAIVGWAARCNASDVALATAAADRAFAHWRGTAPAVREGVLLGAAVALESQGERLFVPLLIDESGSTITKARYEVAAAATFLRAAAGEARRLYGDTFPNDRPDRMSFVVREPLGVVAVISPFNAPLALLAKMAAFPLAAGNTVVAKPSEETPLVAIAFARLLSGVGLPKGVFNVLSGFGGECGEPLSASAAVRGIAFTGSTATGRQIGKAAMDRMLRVQLELGGKNPLLVFDDADPEEAAAIAAAGAFAHAGQICMAPSRIFVARPLAKAFTDALVQQAEGLYLGDLRDERTAFGPVIHEGALHRIARQVNDAIAEGARLMTGGKVRRRCTYEPTVLWEPRRDSAVFCEETFGPVVSVVAVDTVDEAIALANASEYGLSAGVLTRDVGLAFDAARRLRCGSVHIGMHPFQSNAMAPIGGFGLSGFGRSGGKYSTDEFTELKWISLDLGPSSRP